MYLIGRDYRAGEHPWSADRLAAELDIPETALAPVLRSLEKAGLVVATDREQFLPGRDPEGIALAAIIEAARAQQSGRSMTAGRPVAPAAKVMAEVDAAMRRELGDRSLKDLITSV
jgi:DNA-binding IscR family transcriptional regulator